jgi:hypothetical protein
MKDLVKAWIIESPRVVGVLACGVGLPDKTTLTETYSRDFPAAALDNVWRCVADACQVLLLHRLPAARMRWVYENGLLHCVRRSDGLLLGLLTRRSPVEVDAAGLEQLIESFKALRAPPAK